mmetsp:Transcript_34846/g.80570  ORF Transcript_34846/g.80570 Transcript_34846/m.80570 type:complete len:203 (+) Transcript_34846:114-722(+)
MLRQQDQQDGRVNPGVLKLRLRQRPPSPVGPLLVLAQTGSGETGHPGRESRQRPGSPRFLPRRARQPLQVQDRAGTQRARVRGGATEFVQTGDVVVRGEAQDEEGGVFEKVPDPRCGAGVVVAAVQEIQYVGRDAGVLAQDGRHLEGREVGAAASAVEPFGVDGQDRSVVQDRLHLHESIWRIDEYRRLWQRQRTTRGTLFK